MGSIYFGSQHCGEGLSNRSPELALDELRTTSTGPEIQARQDGPQSEGRQGGHPVMGVSALACWSELTHARDDVEVDRRTLQ